MKAINLEQQAQQVWNTPDVAEKKTILLEMIDNFRFKARQEQFRDIVESATKGTRLDKLAADLMLVDNDKVIRI